MTWLIPIGSIASNATMSGSQTAGHSAGWKAATDNAQSRPAGTGLGGFNPLMLPPGEPRPPANVPPPCAPSPRIGGLLPDPFMPPRTPAPRIDGFPGPFIPVMPSCAPAPRIGGTPGEPGPFVPGPVIYPGGPTSPRESGPPITGTVDPRLLKM